MKKKFGYIKKIASIMLIMCLLLSGCSGNNNSGNTGASPKATTTTKASEGAQTGTPSATKAATEAKSILEREIVDKSSMDLSSMSASEITSLLTLEEMAAQMLQPGCYNVSDSMMEEYDYGSILSKAANLNSEEWMDYIRSFQEAALKSESGIPFIYGQDDVHGVNYCRGAVIFPHNIGIGAANNKELTYQMGLAVADEAKLCGMLLNFAPCVAVATEPRWGRTYESYSSDVSLVTDLSESFSKGLLDGGLVVCAKHFFADGSIEYGSGEGNNLVDRGDAKLSDEQIKELLSVYQNLIDNGVQTIMISHSSVNGVKMHENAEYIGKLKNEMGFKGMVLSDWESIHNISGDSLEEQVVTAVNAGIDMLMEPEVFEECRQIIIDAVKDGKISEERITDAVTRIMQVKLDAGVFKDPKMEKLETKQTETGSKEYRELAEKLVEESLVLLKNDNKTLPLKKGAKLYLTGPALDNVKAQCGGWTGDWMGSDSIEGCTTILDGFEAIAKEYGFTIITDSKDAKDADVTILCVGEDSYAEWNGDTEDLLLTGSLGLGGNEAAIKEAKKLRDSYKIPTVTCIVAGRNVLLGDFLKDWDAAVMCYLPGSEAQGVSHVLAGETNFKGKLPMPWYESVDQIKTDKSLFKLGYGLSY